LEEVLSKHLDGICRRMGGFLRGFGDPRIHLSPVSGFITEFRKIMNLAVLHPPGEKQLISYAAAVTAYRVLKVQASGEPADPVAILLQGLAGQSLVAPDLRRKLPLEILRGDLVALLRTPALHFHITVSDRAAFSTAVEEIAGAEGFPLVQQQGPGQGGKKSCAFCRSPLATMQPGQILKCGSCMQALESIRWLPMVPAVAADVSFDLLRRLVSLEVVRSYQQEGKIVLLENGSGIS